MNLFSDINVHDNTCTQISIWNWFWMHEHPSPGNVIQPIAKKTRVFLFYHPYFEMFHSFLFVVILRLVVYFRLRICISIGKSREYCCSTALTTNYSLQCTMWTILLSEIHPTDYTRISILWNRSLSLFLLYSYYYIIYIILYYIILLLLLLFGYIKQLLMKYWLWKRRSSLMLLLIISMPIGLLFHN